MKAQIKNIPKKIYLNLGFDKDELLQDEDFKDLNHHGEVTWCEDKINDTDIEYTLKPAEPAGLTDEEIEKEFSLIQSSEFTAYKGSAELINMRLLNNYNHGARHGAKWARSRMQGDD